MFTSIKDDIKLQFQSGNMLTRIILVNIAVFVFIKMVMVFTSFGDVRTIYDKMIEVLSLHGDAPKVYIYFWSWVTHMFLHEGAWHLIWNMLLLYWFGRIVGDFLGDERMLPLYILGGLAGGIFYIGFEFLLPGSGGGSMAMGASAAVMCMLLTAAMVSPDYHLHLLLIGPVKLKWIAVAMLFMDLIGTAGTVNTGGHFAHLGGALFGIIYVSRLHNGQDLTSGLQKLFDYINNRQEPIKPAPTKKAAMSVVYHKGKESSRREMEISESESFQQRLDTILDKINDKGFDNLSDEEKDFLSRASKKE